MKKIGQLIKSISHSVNGRPFNSSTEIRITHLCSQRCRQCRVYERKTDPPNLSWDNFLLITKRLKQYGAHIGFISGGEATLVPHLDKILIEAKKTFSIATTLVSGLYNKTAVIKEFAAIALENNINIQTSLDGLGEIGDSLRGVNNFSDTVLNHMKLLSELRGESKSLLYANIVLNDLNLDQVPELIKRSRDLGWKSTIGLYHTLTATTRTDEELRLRPGKRLDRLLEFLENNPHILNLDSFIRGIKPFIAGQPNNICPFVDSKILSTRTTIMENGDVHLCYGAPIGNILNSELKDIFNSKEYKQTLKSYSECQGCWSTCYTQRYLLVHPRSIKELFENFQKTKLTKSGKM